MISLVGRQSNRSQFIEWLLFDFLSDVFVLLLLAHAIRSFQREKVSPAATCEKPSDPQVFVSWHILAPQCDAIKAATTVSSPKAA